MPPNAFTKYLECLTKSERRNRPSRAAAKVVRACILAAKVNFGGDRRGGYGAGRWKLVAMLRPRTHMLW